MSMGLEPDSPHPTVLIIDDLPANLGILVEYLEEAGIEVMVARTGEFGLDIAKYAHPDLILLDVMMPGLDGFETCQKLKAHELTQDIPVIFTTALASTEDKVKGFAAGAVDYVTKPLQKEEVLARVTAHLKISELTHRLKKANESLTKLNVDKDKFFSIIAHDLQGPFMPIIGAAEFILQADKRLSDQDIHDVSAMIYNSARRVSHLLDNLLQWSRMQMGRMSYKPILVNLFELFERNVELFVPTVKLKNITLQSTLDQPITVYADEHMVDLILRNLTSNAIKFTPEGGWITLSAKLLPEEQFAEITVADNGVGFSPEALERIFEPSVYYSSLGTSNERGTGLGLVICQEMITRHNGQFIIESQSGIGTTIKFTIPQES
ncbi:MAG: hybrid sensor histidine kinase/response regulator [Anaerolineae bacterium]